MRLIDADKLYDWIKTECNPYGKPTIDFESGCRMLDIIKRMPTAFDKEKVLEELEKASKLYSLSDRDCEFAIRQDKALEIVKKGGGE